MKSAIWLSSTNTIELLETGQLYCHPSLKTPEISIISMFTIEEHICWPFANPTSTHYYESFNVLITKRFYWKFYLKRINEIIENAFVNWRFNFVVFPESFWCGCSIHLHEVSAQIWHWLWYLVLSQFRQNCSRFPNLERLQWNTIQKPRSKKTLPMSVSSESI